MSKRFCILFAKNLPICMTSPACCILFGPFGGEEETPPSLPINPPLIRQILRLFAEYYWFLGCVAPINSHFVVYDFTPANSHFAYKAL